MNEKERMWRERVEAWRSSGLTRKEFCSRHRVKIATLDYWQRRLRIADAAQALAHEPRLIPIDVLTVPLARYEITLANGRRLSLSGHIEVEPLRRLITLLEQTPCG